MVALISSQLSLIFTPKVINYKSVNVSNSSGDERLRKSLFTEPTQIKIHTMSRTIIRPDTR